MTTTQLVFAWLTLGVGIVGSLVALVVAHLHRKQMRQNELFRLDPTVGVIPPPNPLWAYVKSNRAWSFIIGMTVINVIVLLWVNQYSPFPTWLLVFSLGWQLGNLAFGWIQQQIQRIYKLIRTNQTEQAELSRRILDLIGTCSESTLKIIQSQAEHIGTTSGSILGLIENLSNGVKSSTLELIKAIEIINPYTVAPPASTPAPTEPPAAR